MLSNAGSMLKIRTMISGLRRAGSLCCTSRADMGSRVDSHAYAGYTIPPYYDSMIAKIIAVARTREEAINTMHRALSEYVIEGVKTTIPFHLQLMKDEKFRAGTLIRSFWKVLRWLNAVLAHAWRRSFDKIVMVGGFN